MGRKKKHILSHYSKQKLVQHLPVELLAEVLGRLPVKELLRCRCVCRGWRDLIGSSNFAALHLARYKNNCEENRLLVMGKCGRWTVRRDDTFKEMMEFDLLGMERYRVDGYVNGLLLVSYENEIILWNPSIRKCVMLPPSSMLTKDGIVQLGLGFDPLSGDYKVLAVGNPLGAETAPDRGMVEVYSLGTGCWRRIPDSNPCLHRLDHQVFVNGAIYWIGYHAPCYHKRENLLIVSFNTCAEVFKYIKLPCSSGGGGLLESSLGVLDGSLALLDVFAARCCVWVMGRNTASEEAWTKRFTIDLEESFSCDFLHLKNNGEMYVGTGSGGVQSYNLKIEQERKVSKTYHRDLAYYRNCYVESLVLLGGVAGLSLAPSYLVDMNGRMMNHGTLSLPHSERYDFIVIRIQGIRASFDRLVCRAVLMQGILHDTKSMLLNFMSYLQISPLPSLPLPTAQTSLFEQLRVDVFQEDHLVLVEYEIKYTWRSLEQFRYHLMQLQDHGQTMTSMLLQILPHLRIPPPPPLPPPPIPAEHICALPLDVKPVSLEAELGKIEQAVDQVLDLISYLELQQRRIVSMVLLVPPHLPQPEASLLV
ncbi:hypothetical protein Dimus_033097 [Dionaea muscipula]